MALQKVLHKNHYRWTNDTEDLWSSPNVPSNISLEGIINLEEIEIDPSQSNSIDALVSSLSQSVDNIEELKTDENKWENAFIKLLNKSMELKEDTNELSELYRQILQIDSITIVPEKKWMLRALLQDIAKQLGKKGKVDWTLDECKFKLKREKLQ